MGIQFKSIPSPKQLLKVVVRTLTWPQHRAMDEKKHIEVKDTDQLLQTALRLLAQSESAKLCAMMFCLHKTNFAQWKLIREVLLRHATNHRQLSALGTALECSTKSELSSCYPYFPGLNNLVKSSNH